LPLLWCHDTNTKGAAGERARPRAPRHLNVSARAPECVRAGARTAVVAGSARRGAGLVGASSWWCAMSVEPSREEK